MSQSDSLRFNLAYSLMTQCMHSPVWCWTLRLRVRWLGRAGGSTETILKKALHWTEVKVIFGNLMTGPELGKQ